MLESIVASNAKFIIAGDINIHCDEVNSSNTIKLNDLLSMFNLEQLIKTPTHRAGHILDVVITRVEDLEITNVDVRDISLCVHFLLSFNVKCNVERSYYTTRVTRNIRQIDNDTFKNDLEESLSGISMEKDFKECIHNIIGENKNL